MRLGEQYVAEVTLAWWTGHVLIAARSSPNGSPARLASACQQRLICLVVSAPPGDRLGAAVRSAEYIRAIEPAARRDIDQVSLCHHTTGTVYSTGAQLISHKVQQITAMNG